MNVFKHTAMASLLCTLASGAAAQASAGSDCFGLPGWQALRDALKEAVAEEASGLNLQMWATVVNADGVVCAVAFSGDKRKSQWGASRVISAQKANTAAQLSLDASSVSAGSGLALVLSTANLYSATQPGGSLYGLQHSNPVNTEVAYRGPPANYGTRVDAMVGHRIGGINVFGGGFALYGTGQALMGGVGVSGDTSCADHRIGWRLRHKLGLDHMSHIAGVAGITHPDNIIYDITPNPDGGTGKSASGFGHPNCSGTDTADGLPPVVD